MPSKRPVADDTSANAADGPTTSPIGDYDLPKTVVTKIAKSAFEDPTVKVQQDVFLALQKATTVYINYIASAAQETANAANRKTLTNADIYTATTDHLAGIGGDANAADELRRVLDEELAAFRVNQENLRVAKAAGLATGAPRRGFPGRGKAAVEDSAGGVGTGTEEGTEGPVSGEGVELRAEGEDDEDESDEEEEEVEEEEDGDLEAEDLIEELAAGGDDASESDGGNPDAEMK